MYQAMKIYHDACRIASKCGGIARAARHLASAAAAKIMKEGHKISIVTILGIII